MPRSGIVAAAEEKCDDRGRGLSLHVRLLLVALLGSVIGGTAAWWVFPAVAHAATCNIGGFGAYNTEATDGAGAVHNGVRVANLYIYSYTAYCERVSSIGSIHANFDLAEVGEIQLASGFTNCNTVGDGTPHVLTVYGTGTAVVCRLHGALTANQSDAFSVWGDSSDYWTWSHDGMDVTHQTLDFRASTSVTNGERHSTYESAQSLFDGMQNGTSPNWNSWTASQCFTQPDPDPNYFNQLQSATKISVSQASQQC